MVRATKSGRFVSNWRRSDDRRLMLCVARRLTIGLQAEGSPSVNVSIQQPGWRVGQVDLTPRKMALEPFTKLSRLMTTDDRKGACRLNIWTEVS